MIYVKLIFLLSFLDAGITDFGLREHVIQEVNPFAWQLYELSPWVFYMWKLLLPLILLLLYPKVKHQRLISQGIKWTCWIFCALFVYHGFWISEFFYLTFHGF